MTDSHMDADRVAQGEGAEAAPSPEGVEAEPATAEGAEPEAFSDREGELETLVAERTADLQRLQAEYVNYKRRVDRDRDLSRQLGVESVLTDFMPVLDSISLARQHGDIDGGFRLVADELEKVTLKYGLVAFGEVGEVFDPVLHEALMALPLDLPVEVTTISQVMQQGYQLRGRVIRPARVAVANP
ncbi:molecular chaperone GrpE [Tessaracoccus bendigoensis DSM 12906]|uniref:Protein GrpE n=1 Tax=Tessaracoccus bendigoensis DSM 12906 TaxID=1123357 RepID=A0A1M6EK38_9ACTN|nr:molecular chaperone GrpE [Tessaracoccus bendigoensis DSM 12906]